MLVDGAIMDNVPVRVMHELKSGPNIVDQLRGPQARTLRGGLQRACRAASSFSSTSPTVLRRALPRAPGVGTVLMRSLMANRQDFERRLRPDDLLLVPPFPQDMGILDWHRHTELMDRTYRWGMREMARLKGEGHFVFASA